MPAVVRIASIVSLSWAEKELRIASSESSRMLTKPDCSSAGCTDEARKTSR